MRLSIDFEDYVQAILAAIKQEPALPREIGAKQARFIINLPARKMDGELSQNMLFDHGYAGALRPCLVIPEIAASNGTVAG